MIKLSSNRLLAAAALAVALLAPSPGTAVEKPAAGHAPPDHSKFAALQENFATGPEVTRACLTCHANAAKEIHKTEHWKWEYKNPTTGQLLGKRHVVNNFCTSAAANYDSCATCHIGYGMKDGFDFTSEQNVDCLVCRCRPLPVSWRRHWPPAPRCRRSNRPAAPCARTAHCPLPQRRACAWRSPCWQCP